MPSDGARSLRDRLDALVDEMLERGIYYEEARRQLERRFIAKALVESRGSLSRAATRLGLHRNTLTRKIAEHRLKP